MAVVQKKSKVKEQVELYKKATEARFRIAMATYEVQDQKTRRAIDAIRDRLATIATGYIRVYTSGKYGDSVPVTVSPELVDQNILYIAIEIVKDLGYMDIRVENFEFSTQFCAECGERLTPRKKVKK